MTGYIDEGANAKNFRNTSKMFIWSGIIGSIAGILGIKNAMRIMDDARENYDYSWEAGYTKEEDRADGIALKSSVLFGLGVGSIVYGFIRLEKNWAPYATVEGIVEEYNNKLIKELSKKNSLP